MSIQHTHPASASPSTDPRTCIEGYLKLRTGWSGAQRLTPDGLELVPATRVDGRANRCRLRLFPVTSGSHAGKWAAFFYKTSQVPHSQDRYSYGACLFEGDPGSDSFRGWVDYLDSGFHPDLVPADIRRALTFAVPDFDPVTTPAPEPAAVRAEARIEVTSGARELNPGELEIDLFCHGIRIDPSCTLETDARVFSRTRAGLGSGLELIIPGAIKELWLNVPVEEDFAQDSPYRLVRHGDGDYRVHDARGPHYRVRLPREPEWYRKSTSRGTPMSRVGVLQGTYLGIYISNSCGFWYHKPEAGCQFCTTGLNVGVNEVMEKEVEDVVEVARAAKEESGNTFVHFNSGFHGGDKNLEVVAPYVKAVKEQVGALVGVQVVPSPNLWKYDWMIDLGANHFSFCYEFHNPEFFQRYLPGKARLVGQETFFRAMEYCVKKMGKGSCSGEIIAGVEPLEDTLKAIDYITAVGAFPTVCIFRPTIGAAMERFPSPDPDEMRIVMRHMYDACRKNHIPIGLAPNIEVSLIVNPDDSRYLAPKNWKTRLYDFELGLMRRVAQPIFAREMRPQPVKADPANPGAYKR